MAPDKIYVEVRHPISEELTELIGFESRSSDNEVEYIRKDVVDETIEIAEDHAYFAGKENMREELLEKLKVAYDAACNNVYDGPNAIKGLIESLK